MCPLNESSPGLFYFPKTNPLTFLNPLKSTPPLPAGDCGIILFMNPQEISSQNKMSMLRAWLPFIIMILYSVFYAIIYYPTREEQIDISRGMTIPIQLTDFLMIAPISIIIAILGLFTASQYKKKNGKDSFSSLLTLISILYGMFNFLVVVWLQKFLF